MEGSRASAGGGGLYAAQEPREPRQGEEKAGRRRQTPAAEGGGMKFRVSARAPHGVGVLLLVGGAVVAGAAAVVAGRHARRGPRRPAKREIVADGGVVEDGKGAASALELETDRPDDNVQGVASPPEETHRPDDNLRGEEEEEEDETEIGSKNGLLDNNGRVTEDEIQEVHDDAETGADEGSVCSSPRAENFQNSERVVETEFDLDLGKQSSTEISMLHDDDVDIIEHVEKYDDKDPSRELPEAVTHDTDAVPGEKVDEGSITKEDTDENARNSTKNDTDDEQQDSARNHSEKENSSRSEAEKQDDENEEVEASDDQHSQQSMMTTSRPGIVVLDEQSVGGTQEAESMENSPTADLITHPEQLSDDDDMTNDADGETTAEASELEEEGGAVSDNEAPAAEPGQQKEVTMGEPVGVVADAPPALSPSSPAVKVKPAAEKTQAESMENSPTAGLITHPEQLLDDDVANAADGETAAEAEPEEGAVSDKEDALEAEPVGVADAPSALSSPVKVIKPAAEKIEAELPGRVVEAESMENSPTADLIMHPEQLLDDVMNAADGEAPEPEPEEGAVSDKEDAPAAEPVGVADALPAPSSQEKPAEKKEAELPAGRVVEAGMKMEQDYATTNGGRVKERALIGGGGAVAGVVTVDRRSSSMAILALVFALTVGVAIALARLYAPPRATKLQMDLP